MPKSDLDAQIQSHIAAFVDEVNALVREAALEAVREALGDGAAAPRRRGRARKKAGRKAARKAANRAGKRVRRTGAQVEQLAGKALAAIKGKPGRRLGEIAKELRVATKDVRRPVQTLLDGKKVRTTGVRGGTRYFPAVAGGAKKAAKKATRKRRKASRAAKRKTTKGAAKAA